MFEKYLKSLEVPVFLSKRQKKTENSLVYGRFVIILAITSLDESPHANIASNGMPTYHRVVTP